MASAVSLVDADPDLVAGIPHADRALATRVLTHPLYELPEGRWEPRLLGAHRGGFAILVVDGAIIRQLDIADRHCTQILGKHDVLQSAKRTGPLDYPVSWTVFEPSAVAVLDARFTLASQRWPSLGLNLQRRLLDQGDRCARHAATSQLPRIEDRLIGLFWQLAERWGEETPFGIHIGLKLTHEAIGRLAGAQRPTVTLAIQELADAGVLSGSSRDGWLLSPDSVGQLRPAAPVESVVQ